MLRQLGQYKYLAIAVILAVTLVAASGFFFAKEKSEPVYVSKIDKLIYDTKNQPPRYVMELPDLRRKKKPKAKAPVIKINDEVVIEDVAPPEAKPKDKTLEEVLAQIPSLQILEDMPATQNLQHITLYDELTENRKNLLLPQIDSHGRKPWSEYGKTVEVLPQFKKVAVVVKDMGYDPFAAERINKALPSEISLSYSPYASDLGTKILSSRQQGHETYVDLLLSSKDFLKSDSGPLSMSLTISSNKSLERLRQSLSTGAPIGGVVINEGVADLDNQEILQRLLEEIKRRGLLIIDATKDFGIDQIKVEGLARTKADYVIDYIYDREQIRDILRQAEKTAMQKGQVLLVINPKPVIVTEVYDWFKGFSPQIKDYELAKDAVISKPLALVPVSNLVTE